MNKLAELLEFLRRAPDEHTASLRELLARTNLAILILILIFLQLLSSIMLRSITKCFIISLTGLGLWMICGLFLLKRPKYQTPVVILMFAASFLFMVVNRSEYFEIMSIDSVFILGYTWGMMNNTLVDSYYKWKQLTIIEGGFFILRIASVNNLNAEIAVFHFLTVLAIWLARIYFSKQGIIKEMPTPSKSQSIPQNREDLLKFQNLLNHHLPTGLIVLNEDMNNCLFTNHSFRSHFLELGEDNSDAVFEILRQMRVDPEEQREKESKFVIPSFSLHSSQRIFSLSELISYRIRNKRFSEANSLSASCTYYFDQDDTKQGTYDVKVFPLDWDGEKAIGISFQDISYQAQLFTLNLANENKEKAIGIVAHELRNPISGMLGIVKVMEKKSSDPHMKEFITTLKNNISLLLNVLNSILDIKQLNAGKLSLNIDAISIMEILKNIQLLYSYQCAEKGIEFNLEVEPNVSDVIYTDKERLSQILINLSGNALKFTQKGSITIQVGLYPGDQQKLYFGVKDTGIGIKAENINKLFKVFGRIEDSSEMNKQGVGLGLVISNNLVKVLNRNEEDAYITVTSQPGEGTTFSFFLSKAYGRTGISGKPPINKIEEERYEENVNINRIDSISVKRSLRDIKGSRAQDTTLVTTKEHFPGRSLLLENEFILLVDDMSFNLLIFKNFFADLGMPYKQASTGQEAVDIFKKAYQSGNMIAMIFMDLEMPIMGGMEASTMIRNYSRSIGIKLEVPVVAVSGSDGDGLKKSCYDAGMKEFITKPISEAAIMDLLKKYSLVK